jgi:hypothetical protein
LVKHPKPLTEQNKTKNTKNLQSKLKYQRKPLQYLRVLTFTWCNFFPKSPHSAKAKKAALMFGKKKN